MAIHRRPGAIGTIELFELRVTPAANFKLPYDCNHSDDSGAMMHVLCPFVLYSAKSNLAPKLSPLFEPTELFLDSFLTLRCRQSGWSTQARFH